jgi:dimeric dUTPase (all-alpha-NTP-PPase superfamily)
MLNLKELYTMQKFLDEKIVKQHSLENNSLVQERILALYVELGELANETRCFKFWSTKPASNRTIILEEYVDGIHFLLSLGISLSYELNEITGQNQECNKDLVKQFTTIYQCISEFESDKTEQTYERLFKQYILLGELLTFTANEIETAYISKNEVNLERQRTGY